ncbi:uncharacterized protein EI90DRAFT_3021274 [Cantharellus anzutake]|uniref:uncharacterized protein n=1 Tax=Cantharellus anzutake TaxID=1750568 RepID=UPI0019049792|nr:uncharacterized protein EI90DRAFT_3021274 [Cantharellus anzutake]KAF8317741.1 hypothetical protein EI90DRAFT_3021274 [Cantharellus anzutake]
MQFPNTQVVFKTVPVITASQTPAIPKTLFLVQWETDSELDFLLEKAQQGFQKRDGIRSDILMRGKEVFDLAYGCPSDSSSDLPTTSSSSDQPMDKPKFPLPNLKPASPILNHDNAEPVFEFTPRTQVGVSPAFSALLKEEMRSDYNQGYPKGVKFINVVLNNHLTQLESDLDRTWKTTRDCLNLVQDEMDLRANPRRLGSLFKPYKVMPMIKDLEEVMELIFGRILLEATICSEYHVVKSMEFHLWNSWRILREHLYHATMHLTIPRKNNPLAFYCEFQDRIYGRVQQLNLDTLEELQVVMETYRLDNRVLYAEEIWPVERKEEWWREEYNTKE